MKISESAKATPTVQTKAAQQAPFFAPAGRQEAGEKAFFGGSDVGSNGFFKPRSRPVIQAKLTIGRPGDKYEQEADKMAEWVVSRQIAGAREALPATAEKINRQPLAAGITPLVERKAAEEDREEEQPGDKGEPLQRSANFDLGGTPPPPSMPAKMHAVQRKEEVPQKEESILEAKKKIAATCDKKECLEKSGCSKDKCEQESAIIAKIYVDRVKTVAKPKEKDEGDRRMGWMCFEWARLLMRAFKNLELKCWKVNWVGIVLTPPQGNEPKDKKPNIEHNYIFISLEEVKWDTDTVYAPKAPPKRSCGVILDPWKGHGSPIVYDQSESSSEPMHQWNTIYFPEIKGGEYGTTFREGKGWQDIFAHWKPTPLVDNSSPTPKYKEPEGILQRQVKNPEEEDQPKVQTKSVTSLAPARSNIQSRLDAIKGSGNPLPKKTRTQMENTFGADFGSVRVHTGSDAAGLSKDLNAQAFTHGSDVYFNEGKYRPETTEGRRLLGHELVHVVQQGTKNISNHSGFVQRFISRVSGERDRYSISLIFQELGSFRDEVSHDLGHGQNDFPGPVSRSRSPGLVTESNIDSIHEQLISHGVAIGDEIVIFATLIWSEGRGSVQRIEFSLPDNLDPQIERIVSSPTGVIHDPSGRGQEEDYVIEDVREPTPSRFSTTGRHTPSYSRGIQSEESRQADAMAQALERAETEETYRIPEERHLPTARQSTGIVPESPPRMPASERLAPERRASASLVREFIADFRDRAVRITRGRLNESLQRIIVAESQYFAQNPHATMRGSDADEARRAEGEVDRLRETSEAARLIRSQQREEAGRPRTEGTMTRRVRRPWELEAQRLAESQTELERSTPVLAGMSDEELRTIATSDPDSIQRIIRERIHTCRTGIEEFRGYLEEHPDIIWGFDSIINETKREMHITRGSNQDQWINEHIRQVSSVRL